MMLYVFHVDVGRMMNFDMTVALSSVENLKDTIERLHGIPATNIVLLVSGGEMLTQSTQVSYYSAGTDTNPIYMFLTGDSRLPPTMLPSEPDMDLREQVERCLELPAVYETVVTRAQLALRMYDLARDEERLCERLVHEQHLQQQGWSAVVANIEDLTDEFRQRFRNFCAAFDRHLEKRSKYLELLRNFGDDLAHLSRIPILPGLMPLAEQDFHGFDEFLDTDEVFSRSTAQQESVLLAAGTTATGTTTNRPNAEAQLAADTTSSGDDKSSTSPNKKLKMGVEERITSTSSQTSSTCTTRRHNLNLLQWITSRENHNTLKLMSDECIQGLGTFNEEVYEKLKAEVQNIIKLAEQGDVKEIKGLGDRLCKLEEFKYKIKNMVQDQKELSTAFQQNQNRAINLRDASILPDLCASHQSQLLVMLQNHQKIRDHRRCIAKAKDELGSNLHTRLKRIVWIENAMSEFDNRLLFYHRCLRRAERHINIIEQIHQAPCIYVAAVTEVVRRKIFSGEFRQWASQLADDFDSIHSEEINRRETFNTSFEGHFLNILFPGMNDMPPAFANENPLIFDARLPNITKSDIDMLSTHLPDLASQIQLPDMGPVINFFVSRSGEHQKARMEQLIKEQIDASFAGRILQTSAKDVVLVDKGHLVIEAGGCESETDIDFESVVNTVKTISTSMSEFPYKEGIARSTATDQVIMAHVETLTEDNAASTRAEVDRLRDILGAMFKLSMDCIRLARANLNTLRESSETNREDFQCELQALNDRWKVMRMHLEDEVEQRNKLHHDIEVMNEMLRSKDNELQLLRLQVKEQEALHIRNMTMETQLEELRDKLIVVEVEKNNTIAQVRDELTHEHKNEMESLRCRFKLMTSMERSPSDTSLEKIERPTSVQGIIESQHSVIDLLQHESIIAQMRAEHEIDKERAVSAAIEVERSLWQAKILPMNSESVMANGILKDMLEEKERQLEQFREKDLMLTKENYQLKTRLDALTNEEGNSWLKEKIEYLNRDKFRLEEELTMEKSKRQEMENSVAALKGCTYDQGSLPRSKSSGAGQRFIVLESCAKGDIVFVVWSVRHCQFMVVQDSQSLYFVHADSVPALGLRLPSQGSEEAAAAEDMPIPMPYYAIGRVTEKEYCQARKDENRYRVTRGSKFYRIKLAPISSKQATARRERIDSFPSSMMRWVSQYESQSDSSSSTAVAAGASLTGGASRQTISSSSASVVPAMKDVTDHPIAVAIDVPLAATTSDSASAVATTPIVVTASNTLSCNPSVMSFKERTVSITSVTEEDDELASLLVDHCRYVSVSEEEEATTASAITLQQQQSVITEQPTASSKLKLDLLLASADITTTQTTTTTQHDTSISDDVDTIIPDSSTTNATDTSIIEPPSTSMCSNPMTHVVVATATTTTSTAPSTVLFMPTQSADNTSSPSIPASVGTTSEDSDEYRSLEAKDETDFPISE